MTTTWMDKLLVNLTLEEPKYDVFNTKEDAEVLKGLSLNDRLVTKGFETLRNRSKVKVIK